MFRLLDPQTHARTVTNLAASSRFLSSVGLNPIDAGVPIEFVAIPAGSPRPLAPDFDMLERNLELEDTKAMEPPVKPLAPSPLLLEGPTGTISVPCPSCRSQLSVEEEQLGQEGPCPRCEATLEVTREANGQIRATVTRDEQD